MLVFCVPLMVLGDRDTWIRGICVLINTTPDNGVMGLLCYIIDACCRSTKWRHKHRCYHVATPSQNTALVSRRNALSFICVSFRFFLFHYEMKMPPWWRHFPSVQAFCLVFGNLTLAFLSGSLRDFETV